MVTTAALLRVLFAALSLAAVEPLSTPGPLSATAQALKAVSATPQALSPDAATGDLPLLPARPAPPKLMTPDRWEYVTVVTLLSAPFTALWYGLVFGAVESLSQWRVPPKVSAPMYTGLAIAAGGTSLGIALFSVRWGGPARPRDADNAGAAPLARPLPPRSPAGTTPHG